MSSRQGTTRTDGAIAPGAVVDVLDELMRLATQASAQGPLTASIPPTAQPPANPAGAFSAEPGAQLAKAHGDRAAVRALARKALMGAARRMPRGVVLQGPGDARHPNRPGRIAGVVVPELAPWLLHGPRALRLAVEALARECEAHWPAAGRCRECDVPAPCRAWTRLTGLLVREPDRPHRDQPPPPGSPSGERTNPKEGHR